MEGVDETVEVISLTDKPEYTKVVADWIYTEFIENIRRGISYSRIMDSLKNRKKDEIPCTLIAVESNICIGTVSLFENDLKKRDDLTPWLGALYVSEAYRKKGIAKVLIGEVSAIAKKLGYSRLYLRTEHTAEYYKKLGWQSIYKTVDEFELATEVFMKDI